VVRINILILKLDMTSIDPQIRSLHHQKVKKVLDDEQKKYDITKDHININFVIYVSNIIKLLKYYLIMCISAYFLGIFWYIMCVWSNTNNDDGFESFVNNNFGDDLQPRIIADKDPLTKSLICCYWAITTLTTVGFGDYYPINQYEKIYGSIVFCFGVSFFAYVLS